MAGKFKVDFSKLQETVKQEGEKKVFEKDTRFWTPTRDEKGNALVILRFLPDADSNGYIKYLQHSFKYQQGDTVKWYIENCLNTFGFEKGCPICKKVSEYYNSAHTADKEIGAERRSKKNFIANVLIIKNPNKPEEEGRVMLWRFGQKIFDKIKSRMFPSDTDKADEDFKTFIPFDVYEGANFKLKVKGAGRDTNYDDSVFADPSELFNGNDDKIEVVMNKTHKLSEFVQEDKYPTNEFVISKIGHLFGISAPKAESYSPTQNSIDDIPDFTAPFSSSDDDDDDDDAFFAKIKS
jgi:hypothetical protein